MSRRSTRHWRKPDRQGARLRVDWSTLLSLYTVRLVWQQRRFFAIPAAAFAVDAVLARAELPTFKIVALVVLLVGAVVILDVEKPPWWVKAKARERAWSSCRRMARMWTWACLRVGIRGADAILAGNPYPKAVDVERGWGGNFAFTVKIPPGLELSDLRKRSDRLGTVLQAKDVRLLPHISGDLNKAAATVIYASLPVPVKDQKGNVTSPLRATVAPMVHGRIRVALGHMGWCWWDPDLNPHATVKGVTGSGKTFLGRLMALQWEATPNHRLILLDPKDGADTDEIARLPGASRYGIDPRDVGGSLARILGVLQDCIEFIATVQQLCKRHKVEKWSKLPAAVKERYPRRLVYFEELTTGLMKLKDETKDVREEIGNLYAKIILTGRAGGVHTLTVDQVTLSGETYLPAPVLTQMEFVVAIGQVATRHAEPICGTIDVPEISEVMGRCVVGQRGKVFTQAQIPYLDHQAFLAYCKSRAAQASRRQQAADAKTQRNRERRARAAAARHSSPGPAVNAGLSLPADPQPGGPRPGEALTHQQAEELT